MISQKCKSLYRDLTGIENLCVLCFVEGVEHTQ